MGMVMNIDLENVRFYSYHGFYPEEQILGNEYSVTINTSFNAQNLGNDELEKTVNYEELYAIATNCMKEPQKLLETVAQMMLEKIQLKFPNLQNIKVSICKINPLFGGDQAQARVSLLWQHND